MLAGLSLSTAVITFHRARGARTQCKMLASLANAAQVFFAEDPCLSLVSATNVNSSDLDNAGLQRSILFGKQKYSIKCNKKWCNELGTMENAECKLKIQCVLQRAKT